PAGRGGDRGPGGDRGQGGPATSGRAGQPAAARPDRPRVRLRGTGRGRGAARGPGPGGAHAAGPSAGGPVGPGRTAGRPADRRERELPALDPLVSEGGGRAVPAVLALDGGNSKTDVALVAADGTVLAT